MNEPIIFNNPEFGQIRTITEICGNDVANALGYKRPKDAIAAHCKGAVIAYIAAGTAPAETQEPIYGTIRRVPV